MLFIHVLNGSSSVEKCFFFHFRTDGLKIGTMVGTDQFGNRYYENKKFFMGMLLH